MGFDRKYSSFPACRQRKALLIQVKASLYFVDGGDQTRELIDSVGEPWRPLSRFIVENSHVKHRTPAEIQELRSQRDAYCYEYAQRESWLVQLRRLFYVDIPQYGIRLPRAWPKMEI